MNWGLIIVIAIIVIVVLFVIGLYNGLVQRRLRIDEAFAQIEVQLKRRHDLIPNLVNAVKGYMGFEQKVLTDVTNARAAAVAAGTPRSMKITWRPLSSSVSGPNIGCTLVTWPPAARSAARPLRSGLFSEPTSKTMPLGGAFAISARIAFVAGIGAAITISS
jgi:hypothetical protein